MNYEKFAENVQADLAKSLSDTFLNVSVETVEVNKLQGQSYTGITIKHDESAVAPSINLEPFYEMYENGEIYEDVLQKITDVVVSRHKKMNPKHIQFRHSQRKRLYRSLKIEYTFIRYVPVVGARASATSAIRHDCH